jgi:hypothetical protein
MPARAQADERLEAVVQLAASHEHRAHLGQLALLAAAPVGLGVDDEELRGGDGAIEHQPPSIRRAEDDMHLSLRRTGRIGPRRTLMAAAAQQSPTREEERRVREAWAAYREDVRELEGREYEDAEDEAWARLQRRLAEIRR